MNSNRRETVRGLVTIYIFCLIASGCRIREGENGFSEQVEVTPERNRLETTDYNTANYRLESEVYPLLIYRYSFEMCWSCISEDLDLIETFQTLVGKERVLILPAYPEDRIHRIRLTNDLTQFRYRNMLSDSLSFPVDKTGAKVRYMAIMYADGTLEKVFFPRRNGIKRTKMYFAEIKEYFVTNSHNAKN